MSNTIDYYNKNAESYYLSTIDADFSEAYDRFLQYVPENGSIIDIGCGSGRDVKAFCDMGYRAIGLDASPELAAEAEKQLGIEVIVGDMAEWIADEPFDGVWCCAALLHLHEEEAERFLRNLQRNVKRGGIIFLSVKDGIETGVDEKGRYMRDYSEDEIRVKLEEAGFGIIEINKSEDKLGRGGFWWLNVFARNDSTACLLW